MLQSLCERSCTRAAARHFLCRSLGRRFALFSQTGPRHKQYGVEVRRRRGVSVSAIGLNGTPTNRAIEFAAAKDLPKNFEPKVSEEKIYQWWEHNHFFQPNLDAKGEPFVILMPPPNVTGRLHMGHAMFVSLQDIMTRFARMRGKRMLWLPGTDHAGIATQMVVERMLEEEGSTREKLGRDAFLKRVWEWKEEYGGYITRQMRRLGASCDWSRERFTLDEGLSCAVAEAFVRLHDKGLIYKGSYMVNWAPKLQTAVSDLEVEYTEEQGTLYYFKYPLHNSSEFIPVATSRPETILGDTAVAVHPEDPRYKHLIGKECIVPTTDRRIQIVADEYVDREFGTGALKITPGHDPNDYELGKRLDLDVINIMNKDATLNEKAGKYKGMDRFAARSALWEDMGNSGLVIKQEPYLTRVPRSQRGGEIIEPLVSDQWFVKMEGLAKPALNAVAKRDLIILPERYEKVFIRWLTDIKDWCISRQLWWGHRIPVWYVHGASSRNGGGKEFVVARNESEAYKIAVAKYGKDVTLEQESDVLDTWFSSGLWPFSTMGWPDEDQDDFKQFYPGHVLETAHDILFFWVARMVMMGIELTGKVPFSTIYLHGLVRDDKGRKMSKSIGNVVDPLKVADEVGTDPLRYGLVTGTAPGQDLNLSMDRITSARNFTNKVWNIGKFIGSNLPKDQASLDALVMSDFSSQLALSKLPLSERWVVSRLHEVTDSVTKLQENYNIGEAGKQLYEFVWGEYADWFLEAAKDRLYGTDPNRKAECMAVLVYCYNRILRLLHPFMPFVTEELWQSIPHSGESLIIASWPLVASARDNCAMAHFTSLQMTVKSIRNVRAEYDVDLGRKIVAKILVEDEDTRLALHDELGVIVLLARLDEEQASIDNPGLSGAETDAKAVACVVRDGIEVILPMSGLFDAAKELERLEKQKAKVEKELGPLQNRLENKGFVAKAPPNVVDGVRKQKEEIEQKLVQIQEKMLQMQNL